MPNICPKCGKFSLHRSHTSNTAEQVIKTFLPIRPYRCGECKWRGWRLKERTVNKNRFVKNLVLYSIVFAVALLFALYMRSMFQ
jgi:hypothetical protein